jgi:hypothetical protein
VSNHSNLVSLVYIKRGQARRKLVPRATSVQDTRAGDSPFPLPSSLLVHKQVHFMTAVWLSAYSDPARYIISTASSAWNGPVEVPFSWYIPTSLTSLPDELLVHIAKYTLNRDQRGRSGALRSLCAICARLRRVYVRTPQLWAIITAHEGSTAWLHCCVSRSRTHPLDVHLYVTEDDPCRFELVLRNLHRVESLKLIVEDDAGAESFIAAMRAGPGDSHSLRSLEVVLDCDLRRSVPLMPSAGHPNLTTLDLMGASIDAIPPLPQLRYIYLLNIGCTVARLRQLFDHTPLLESAEFGNAILHDHLLDDGDTQAPLRVLPVVLPNLQFLSLNDEYPRETAFILSLFPCPSTSVQVSTWDCDESDGYDEVIIHHLKRFWNIAAARMGRVGPPFPQDTSSRKALRNGWDSVPMRRICAEGFLRNGTQDFELGYGLDTALIIGERGEEWDTIGSESEDEDATGWA